ncbi:MAG: flavin reductase family protein [Candidatus Thorarchaeota archaeon]|nr:flavin reductase family protein [Candidatus Thorarchaeota archaeon]
MSKIKMKSNLAPFPKPGCIIGAMVDGRPNFMNIVWVNRMNISPNILAASVNVKHYTLKGIKQNQSFSLNFPSIDLVEKTDYVGLVSGRDVDKSKLFEVFYGDDENTPMIRECPINIECKVHDMVELPDHVVVFGEVLNVYSEEQYMTDGALDPKKFNPIVFTRPGPIGTYWKLGDSIGRAWSIGKNLFE